MSRPLGTLQERVEKMEADRQGKASRVAGHPLFSAQQQPAPEPQPQQTDHQQVIMEAVTKALSTHYAQQAVVHAKKGGSLGKVLAVAKKKATVKKPAAKRSGQ